MSNEKERKNIIEFIIEASIDAIEKLTDDYEKTRTRETFNTLFINTQKKFPAMQYSVELAEKNTDSSRKNKITTADNFFNFL